MSWRLKKTLMFSLIVIVLGFLYFNWVSQYRQPIWHDEEIFIIAGISFLILFFLIDNFLERKSFRNKLIIILLVIGILSFTIGKDVSKNENNKFEGIIAGAFIDPTRLVSVYDNSGIPPYTWKAEVVGKEITISLTRNVEAEAMNTRLFIGKKIVDFGTLKQGETKTRKLIVDKEGLYLIVLSQQWEDTFGVRETYEYSNKGIEIGKDRKELWTLNPIFWFWYWQGGYGTIYADTLFTYPAFWLTLVVWFIIAIILTVILDKEVRFNKIGFE